MIDIFLNCHHIKCWYYQTLNWRQVEFLIKKKSAENKNYFWTFPHSLERNCFSFLQILSFNSKRKFTVLLYKFPESGSWNCTIQPITEFCYHCESLRFVSYLIFCPINIFMTEGLTVFKQIQLELHSFYVITISGSKNCRTNNLLLTITNSRKRKRQFVYFPGKSLNIKFQRL